MMELSKMNSVPSVFLVALFLTTVAFGNSNGQHTSVYDTDELSSVRTSSHTINQNLFDRPGGSVLLQRATNLTTRITEAGSCQVDVCFALDGSASLSPLDYQYQKEFVQLTSLVIATDRSANYAAVQYGSASIGISKLTNNVTTFVNHVAESQFARAQRTFVAAGLLFCTTELNDTSVNKDKIVLFGDGGVNFRVNPQDIADRFLPPQGDGAILTVGVGNENRSELEDITGRRDAFVSISDQEKVPEALERAVEFLCEL